MVDIMTTTDIRTRTAPTSDAHDTHTGREARAHRPQLADIAEQTGFSLATVSKVLNGRTDVSEHTRHTINEALRANGYVRRKNSRKPNPTIEIVFESFDTIWALEILRGVIHAAQMEELSVITTESGDRRHPGADWIDGVLRRAPVGVILVFSNLTNKERERLVEYNIPTVILDPSGDPSPENLSIQADNWTGGLIATRHLLSLGHTRIGIITGPMTMMCSRARLDGYSAALAERGLVYDASLVREGDFHTEEGRLQAMSLLADPQARPSAIFVESDLMAMGVYEAARSLGIRIPEDLSVVGFDNIQTAQFMSPPLTTVTQPLEEMGATATRTILDRQHGLQVQPRTILPTTLVVRDSTQRADDADDALPDF